MTEDKIFKCLVCGEEYTKKDGHHCLDRQRALDDKMAVMRSAALEAHHRRRERK